jgi:hypothetical protein
MTKILKLYLIPLVVLHLWIASQFELSNDEAYYWLFSKHLDWGFFDHPPIVGLIIKTLSFLPTSEVVVRAGFIILQAVTAFIIIGLAPASRQLLALVLFLSFPLASFSGLFALPDLPLLLMSTLYCLFLKRYLEHEDKISILGLILTIPLLLYSKYHGILLIVFTIIGLPKLLKKKSFYLITILSVLVFLPHVIWQYDHEFATLRYHFLERPKSHFSIVRLAEYTMTQVFLAGLFCGPLIWWSILKEKSETDFERVLKFICIGTFFFFLISTISKKFEANWTIFLTSPIIYLALRSALWDKKWTKYVLVTSFSIVFFSRILLVFDSEIIKIKRLKEFHGWRNWVNELKKRCERPILANTYQIASKVSFYANLPVHSLNFQSRKNQFDFWTPDSTYYQTGPVCYVSDKKQFGGELIQTPDGRSLFVVKAFNPQKGINKSP